METHPADGFRGAPVAQPHLSARWERPLDRPGGADVGGLRMVGLALLAALATFSFAAAAQDAPAARRAEVRSTDTPSTADHSRFDALKRPFRSGVEVTRACLGCHTEAAKQLHGTLHWTWELANPLTGQTLGKRHVLNNYFISTTSNLPSCTQCHIGNGWVDDGFDFGSEEVVDCLTCHDTTGQYPFEKFHNGQGDCVACHDVKPTARQRPPRPRPDLAMLAQAVGKPSRAACGACHFRGDGGDGYKHGDLDTSLAAPPRDLDVHMAADGLNFSCTACHTMGGHALTGSRYVTTALDLGGIDVPGRTDRSRATCESCHGLRPHPETNHPKLNDHTDRVACATCHVTEFARGGRKTLVEWDWSKAGERLSGGRDKVEKDAAGYTTYHSRKGALRWDANVVPTYRWFNGRFDFVLAGEPVDGTPPVELNRISGSPDDPGARIWPFKVMHGRQPFDPQNGLPAIPHLSGDDADAYWKSFDWAKSIAAGMRAQNLPFGGEVAFVETRYAWPIQHMVAPKEKALQCNACHVRGGRLKDLAGFYMPGRDSYEWLTVSGWLAVLMTLAGVLGHAAMRLLSRSLR